MGTKRAGLGVSWPDRGSRCMVHPPSDPTAEEATVTHVRASALSGMLQAIDDRGAAARADLIGGLSSRARDALQEAPGPFQWLETGVVNELMAAYEARFGGDDIEQRVGFTARQQLTVIHAWMQRLLNPETILQQASTLYRFYYRGGAARAEEVGPGRARLVVWARGLYPAWYTLSLPLWIAGALRLIGAREAQVVHAPPERGFRHGYEITWNR